MLALFFIFVLVVTGKFVTHIIKCLCYDFGSEKYRKKVRLKSKARHASNMGWYQIAEEANRQIRELDRPPLDLSKMSDIVGSAPVPQSLPQKTARGAAVRKNGGLRGGSRFAGKCC
jgi:hypothetical protein